MNTWIQRTIMMGPLLALAVGAGACDLPLGEVPCGDGWCPGAMVCLERSRCVPQHVCGNGILDPGEDCDDGNTLDGDGCSVFCQMERCGNGVVDHGEQCDDGNTLDGDGCSASCQIERCGNGVVDHGEQCDDGAGGVARDSATCDRDCTFALCGDGYLNIAAGEQCDDGPNNGKAGSSCSVACRLIN